MDWKVLNWMTRTHKHWFSRARKSCLLLIHDAAYSMNLKALVFILMADFYDGVSCAGGWKYRVFWQRNKME